MTRMIAAMLFVLLVVTPPVLAAENVEIDIPRLPAHSSQPDKHVPLPALYASFATLQVCDAYSTMRALQHGAVEANPVMRGVAGKPAALFAVKGLSTLAAIYATEHLRRSHHGKQAMV